MSRPSARPMLSKLITNTWINAKDFQAWTSMGLQHVSKPALSPSQSQKKLKHVKWNAIMILLSTESYFVLRTTPLLLRTVWWLTVKALTLLTKGNKRSMVRGNRPSKMPRPHSMMLSQFWRQFSLLKRLFLMMPSRLSKMQNRQEIRRRLQLPKKRC